MVNQISQMNDLIQKIHAYASEAKNEKSDTVVNGINFESFMKNALDNVNKIQTEAENIKTRVEMEDPTVNLVQAKILSEKAKLHLEMVMEVRNKIVNFYQQMSRMEF